MNNNTTFASLALAEPLLRAIKDSGYTTPTPIQAQAIPHVLQGGDVLAAAQTGTGKTAGFTLPILHQILSKPVKKLAAGRPRALILTPTRELAAQVEESVRLYSRHTAVSSLVLFGGVNINPQTNALRKPIDIVVATPGRLLDHVGQKNIDLSGVETIVLDEADRMLDMGFIRDIRRILKLVPEQRQSLLFSATFSDEIRALAKSSLRDPVEISVTPRNTASELITQEMVQTEQRHKRDLVSHIIRQSGWHQVLVFCRTKHGANRLADKLSKDGLSAAALHGNKSQAARTRALAGFKNGKVAVLVATDIAARGLDIDQLPYVINFELPQVAEDYVHRIGRTGRAGSEGRAISLVDTSETRLLKAIERLIKRPITPITIEGFTPSSEPEPVAPSHPAADATRSRNRRPNTAGTSSRSKSRSGNRSAPKRSSSTAPRNLQPIE
ncbi:DEAD/DEAH box helicase [Paenalcaligenes hominis]|uniref:ATP-dependent RNA helicase RhlE n=3 Tax=Paenalcaligenes hominis TaxID=643674 RepID=A0ABX0WR85_9BURK|nr:DEAD/DEAH box helicase [Paenalcaligenes hominis]NJB65269.1 ATP-dependent RNA helicase RhlE [Paenalcaligenes hominis]GGE72281.1 ATP-dependent RNA helicase RhlE [Paenalcaligenes hominis]